MKICFMAFQRLGPFELDAVYPLDCMEAMKQLPAHSFDVAFADPPYNASKGRRFKSLFTLITDPNGA